MIDHSFPYDNQYHEVHNPNLAFNHQVTAPINQLEHVVSEATLLASVMVTQPIIQAVISWGETFDCTKSKCESWITSVENAAKILKQDILCIAIYMMTGSPLTSASRLRDLSIILNMKTSQKWTLKTILYNILQQSCHPSFCPSTAWPRWAT